jgi:hypothetical protein
MELKDAQRVREQLCGQAETEKDNCAYLVKENLYYVIEIYSTIFPI